MRRVSPSVIAREQLRQLLVGGADRETNIVSALVETVTRQVVQELLEGEQQDFLGGRYDRRREDQAGSRNGYERGRLRTAEGFVDVAVPQVAAPAEPFRSSLMGVLDGNSEVLESLVNEMYARGLSTRDVEDAFRDATGELLISKSAVSEITDRLWEDYQAFISRDLSGVELEYLFVDAVFESLRRHGAKEALLVGWAIAADGGKHLLHLAVGNKESEACWTEFFRSLLNRGLRLPRTRTRPTARSGSGCGRWSSSTARCTCGTTPRAPHRRGRCPTSSCRSRSSRPIRPPTTSRSPPRRRASRCTRRWSPRTGPTACTSPTCTARRSPRCRSTGRPTDRSGSSSPAGPTPAATTPTTMVLRIHSWLAGLGGSLTAFDGRAAAPAHVHRHPGRARPVRPLLHGVVAAAARRRLAPAAARPPGADRQGVPQHHGGRPRDLALPALRREPGAGPAGRQAVQGPARRGPSSSTTSVPTSSATATGS